VFWAYLKEAVFGYLFENGCFGTFWKRLFSAIFFWKWVFWAYLKASVFGYFFENVCFGLIWKRLFSAIFSKICVLGLSESECFRLFFGSESFGYFSGE